MTDFYIVYYLSRSTRAQGGCSYCSMIPAAASSLAAPVICLIKLGILVSRGPQVTVSTHLLPWQDLSSLCAPLLLEPCSVDGLGAAEVAVTPLLPTSKDPGATGSSPLDHTERNLHLLSPSHPSLLAPLLGNPKEAKSPKRAQTQLVQHRGAQTPLCFPALPKPIQPQSTGLATATD